MTQRERIKEYLASIAPACIRPLDIAINLGMNENSCRTICATLANEDGSGIKLVFGHGYTYGEPTNESQEMYWHDRAVRAEKAIIKLEVALADSEAIAYEALTKVDKQELRIKYQHEALVALQKLQDLDNDTKE